MFRGHTKSTGRGNKFPERERATSESPLGQAQNLLLVLLLVRDPTACHVIGYRGQLCTVKASCRFDGGIHGGLDAAQRCPCGKSLVGSMGNSIKY